MIELIASLGLYHYGLAATKEMLEEDCVFLCKTMDSLAAWGLP